MTVLTVVGGCTGKTETVRLLVAELTTRGLRVSDAVGLRIPNDRQRVDVDARPLQARWVCEQAAHGSLTQYVRRGRAYANRRLKGEV